MTETKGRKRRVKPFLEAPPPYQDAPRVPKSPRCYCPSCGYGYGTMGDTEGMSAELAMATDAEVECPECDAVMPPLPDKPRKTDLAPPPMAEPIKKIIEHVFKVNYSEEWQRLHDNLVVGEQRTDHATVAMALDFAEDNARSAHKLWVNMKLEYERYKVDREVIWATMRLEATRLLQAEKANKERSKTITEADVKAKMAERHPDEFSAVEMDKQRFELAVEHASKFSDLWTSKCKSLQTILGKMRGGGER